MTDAEVAAILVESLRAELDRIEAGGCTHYSCGLGPCTLPDSAARIAATLRARIAEVEQTAPRRARLP